MRFTAVLLTGGLFSGLSVADGVMRRQDDAATTGTGTGTATGTGTESGSGTPSASSGTVASTSGDVETALPTLTLPPIDTTLTILPSSSGEATPSTSLSVPVITLPTETVAPITTASPSFTTGVSTTGTSSGAAATATVDLASAQLTNAQLVLFDGEVAILVSPPANGNAVISVTNNTVPETGPSEGVAVSFDVTVVSESAPARRKRATEDTGCTLAVVVGDQTVYNDTLDANSGDTANIVTSPVASVTNNTVLSIIETCGDDPAEAVVNNVLLVAAPLGAATTSGFTSATASESGTGTESLPSFTLPTTFSLPTFTFPSVSVPTGSDIPVPTFTESLPTSFPATSASFEVTPSSFPVSFPTTGTEPTATPSATAAPLHPPFIGDFEFYGCIGSFFHFPTFDLAGSSDNMDLETCASICASDSFAGVFENDCYCGGSIDTTNTTQRYPEARCNHPCPGNPDEGCGGNLTASVARRQLGAAVPSTTILLTVYVRIVAVPSVSTVSTTITSVTTATVTTTTTAGELVTLTTVYPTAVPTVVSCVNGYCGVGWTFVAYPGSECSGEVVYIVEECSCEGGWAYKPLLCSGDDCASMTVYKPVECSVATATATAGGSETIVFQPSACSTCEGGVIFTQAATTSAATKTATAIAATKTKVSTVKTVSAAATATTLTAGSGSTSTTATVVPVVTAGADRLVTKFGSVAAAVVALAFLL